MITASAPGKLNLILLVGKPDQRGYHPLYSIFETLNIRERATVRFRPQHDESARIGMPIVVHTLGADLSDLEPTKHLAFRAARALILEADELGIPAVPDGHVLEIEIEKSIPVAGGMAGGSADAAATLLAVDKLLGLNLDRERMHEIARGLGADVPACLEGGISLGLGYGDHMTRLDQPDTPEHYWVMCTMGQGLSTPAVFKEFDVQGRGRSKLPTSLREGDWRVLEGAEQLVGLLENDLQETALSMHPTLGKAWKVIEEVGPLAVLLSGSGPTVAALATSLEHAHQIEKRLAEAPEVENTLVVSGPAQPAKVE